ncbi:SAC domain-containing protein 8 [Perilla frutescens var. hirtella]|uniref:SAC domain-containing protein 8 n=1 Tax=Perilla frutescens var. hirtella TaxID=608512 RepID=A0AAD4PFV8_PERFH|nr:SAC domain-containing protein 8 [Perilla frutescens var. frutescens]KAH6787077.1 SAC domain-containing protein 8 [Perilla frutescens var. hirtella]KAH6837565.1 SAC domain-containing protein 8 [Perilla frutescens var. hirtella]
METEIQSNSNRGFKLWSELELLEFADKFVIKSVESPDQGFCINRFDGNIDKLNGDGPSGSPKVSTIYGVAGTIRLLAGTYVLVITSRKEVGNYLGFPVFRVTSMRFLSCNEASRNLASQEKKDEDYFMTLLRIVESTHGLYYSYGTDITLNLQRRCKLAKGWESKPIWKQGDPRFVWNRNLLEELIENKLKDSPAVVKILSRRCTRRLGTRMWRRGANLEGDAANFIETEQLLEFEDHISSFLQVRGSIPLLWEQIVDLSYKPRLQIINHEQTSKVVERHFYDLLKRYGGCIVVDLTDKHGDEGMLSKAYAEETQKLPNVRYVSFDFHQSCGHGNFDNIQLLYDQISEDFEKQGYFLLDSEGKILAEQEGIIRSNCIDCLDRTNVTQSYLAQKSLNSQLQRIGAISSTESVSMFSEDFEIFKTLWVDHGDEISLEYSGTHALKRDLVRYGKQTMSGIIKDGISALSRYFLNNFLDGARQDAIDLISGHYTMSRIGPSPFQPKGLETLSYLPVASALVLGGLTVTSITLNQAGRNAQHFLSSAVCAGLTAGLMAVIKANGRQICSRPRLCGLF